MRFLNILLLIMSMTILFSKEEKRINNKRISFVYKIDLDQDISSENIALYDSSSVFLSGDKVNYEELLKAVVKELKWKSKKLYIIQNPHMFRDK